MKRFTETNKWRDPWFRRLTSTAKLLWEYLTDNCDAIGLVEIDMKLLSEDLGCKVTAAHLSEFGDRLQSVTQNKFFLPKFIGFQYGELSDKCPPHKTIIRLIEIHQLRREGLIYLHPKGTAQPAIPDARPKTEKPPRPTMEMMLKIYDAYPKKLGRKDAIAAIEKALVKIDFEKLLGLVNQYAEAVKEKDFQFVPYPATWFNGEHFFDDPAMWSMKPPVQNGTASVFELTKIIEAKKKLADDLRNRHATEGPLTTDWSSDEAKKNFSSLQRDIRELTGKISQKA